MSNVVDLQRPAARGGLGGVGKGGGVRWVGGYTLEKLEMTSTSHLLLARFAGLSTTDA